MNDLYEVAKRRLEAIRAEEKTLIEFVNAHERARKILGPASQPSLFDDALVPIPATPASVVGAPSREDAAPKKGRVTDNPKSSVVVAAAISILREGGHPLSRRQLHRALWDRGVEVNGGDPVKTLGTILWRAQDKLVQLEGFGYWPKGDAYQPAEYQGAQ